MNELYLRALVNKLTKVASMPTLNATIDHLVYGKTQDVAARNNGVQQEAVARLSTRITQLDKDVEELYKMKYNR